MEIEFLFKIIIKFCVYYFLESRFLYSYEINGHCSTRFTLPVEKVIKNKVCEFIFPREFKMPREILDGKSRISIIGLVHFLIFYFPVQISYLVSIVICFYNIQDAEKLVTITFNIMVIGLVLNLLARLIAYIIESI